MRSDTLLLYNHEAGTAKTDDGSFLRLARELGVETATSECLESASRTACAPGLKKLLERGVRRLIVAGGDGSIHRVVNALAPEFPPIELAIVPLGTGNDLARSLGISLEPLEALREALVLPSRPLDLFRIQTGDRELYVANAATAGFGAEVTSRTDPDLKARWGAAAYWLTAVNQYLQLKQYEVVIETDVRRIEESIYGLAIGNGRYAGGGFVIAPDARLDDGALQLQILPVLPTFDLLTTSAELSIAGQLESDQLISLRTRRIQLSAEPAIPVSIDGELEELAEATIEVAAGRLQVCCAAATAAVVRSPQTKLA